MNQGGIMLTSFLLAFALTVNAHDYRISDLIQVMQVKNAVEATSLQENEETNTYPKYEHIPLPDDLKKYIYNESEKYGISYELMLSIAYVESKFDTDVLSYDSSSTGLYQLNKNNTVGWICKQMGVKKLNPNNPYEATRMVVWYVDYLKKKYLAEGYDEENVTKRVLLAYRFGASKSKRVAQRMGLNHGYVKAVLSYKYKLESGAFNNGQ